MQNSIALTYVPHANRYSWVVSILGAVSTCLIYSTSILAAEDAPKLNKPYFSRMPRAWVELISTDSAKGSLQVRTRSGEVREVFIRPETTLRVRDSFGSLEDFYPGESLMLFICHDAQGNWVFPRAVQDELQMMSSHGWQWTVDRLDRDQGVIELSRREQGAADAKVHHERLRISERTVVWKGASPSGLEALNVGDVVLFQSRYDAGETLRFGVEFFDADGLTAIKSAQLHRHLSHLQQTGLQAVVNDLDVLTGSLQISVLPQGAQAAKQIKSGDALIVERVGETTYTFTASVLTSQSVRKEQKLHLVAESTDIVDFRIGDLVVVRPGASDAAK